jgi:hypothetical protein
MDFRAGLAIGPLKFNYKHVLLCLPYLLNAGDGERSGGGT